MPTTELDVKKISEQVAAASEPCRRLLEQMHRVIVGQDELLHRMLIGLLSNGHMLIEGVPGLAKTTAVSCLAGGSTPASSGCSSRPTCCPRT
jgi:MoxR-like ATPase